MLTAFFERNLVYGIVKAQRSFIINYGIGIRIMVFYRHIAQSLITPERYLGALSMARAFSSTDKGLIHQVLGFVVLAFLQQALYFRQGFQCLGVAVVARCARPQGDVVQRNGLLLHPAVGHHTEVTVAQGEALLPDLGGSSVGEVPLRLGELLLATAKHE